MSAQKVWIIAQKMQCVPIPLAATLVPAALDLLEMEQTALVRYIQIYIIYKHTYIISIM